MSEPAHPEWGGGNLGDTAAGGRPRQRCCTMKHPPVCLPPPVFCAAASGASPAPAAPQAPAARLTPPLPTGANASGSRQAARKVPGPTATVTAALFCTPLSACPHHSFFPRRPCATCPSIDCPHSGPVRPYHLLYFLSNLRNEHSHFPTAPRAAAPAKRCRQAVTSARGTARLHSRAGRPPVKAIR